MECSRRLKLNTKNLQQLELFKSDELGLDLVPIPLNWYWIVPLDVLDTWYLIKACGVIMSNEAQSLGENCVKAVK
jgi:hypothetical protein